MSSVSRRRPSISKRQARIFGDLQRGGQYAYVRAEQRCTYSGFAIIMIAVLKPKLYFVVDEWSLGHSNNLNS